MPIAIATISSGSVKPACERSAAHEHGPLLVVCAPLPRSITGLAMSGSFMPRWYQLLHAGDRLPARCSRPARRLRLDAHRVGAERQRGVGHEPGRRGPRRRGRRGLGRGCRVVELLAAVRARRGDEDARGLPVGLGQRAAVVEHPQVDRGQPHRGRRGRLAAGHVDVCGRARGRVVVGVVDRRVGAAAAAAVEAVAVGEREEAARGDRWRRRRRRASRSGRRPAKGERPGGHAGVRGRELRGLRRRGHGRVAERSSVSKVASTLAAWS